MLATVLITTAIAILAMLPGPIMLRGTAAQPGQRAAAATVSLVTMLLATALLGAAASAIGLGQLPAWVLAPVSLAGCAGAWLLRRTARPAPAPVEWQGLALAALMAAFGVFCLTLAIRHGANGSLAVHSWYNADWFKHLGHVHALANYGVPARDIFGGGQPLHYYWLFYVLPGAGTALGGDAWAALATANILVTILFAQTYYGLIRLAGPSPALALPVALLGLLVTAPAIYFLQFAGGASLHTLVTDGEAPEPALMIIPQVIPQHALVLTGLLAWALLQRPGSGAPPALRIFAWISLAASLTLSTLLGAMLLAAYGLTSLWTRFRQSLVELPLVAIGAALLLVVLGVLQGANPDAALESPLFGNQDTMQWHGRVINGLARLFGVGGLAFVCALFAVRLWKPAGEAQAFIRKFAICLIAAAIACVILSEALLPLRLAIEIVIRARLVIAVGIALIGAWALAEAWRRKGRILAITSGVVAVLAIAATPAAIVRTMWLANFGDRFTTEIPTDDMRVLAALRKASGPAEQVWQYPEPPQAAFPIGDDNWTAIVAGRTVPNSLRATDYPLAAPYIEASQRWFAGEDVPIPAAIGWVYLSRVLHPASYDALAARLAAPGSGWTRRACFKDACLFSRKRGN